MIKGIFAVDYWGGMGLEGSLPWAFHSEDMNYFKEHTLNNIVVMGRKTWDDPQMPKPLKNRQCYVVTNRELNYDHVRTLSGNINEKIIQLQENFPRLTVWIIGGPTLLMQTKPLLEELHITHFKAAYKTDCKLDLNKFLLGFRVTGSKPSLDRQCNWMTYKNIDLFR